MATDVGGLKQAPLPLQRKIDPKVQDAKLHQVAELYEEQFLREMVKAMRGTVSESGLIKTSQGETLYREQLDQKYTEEWTKKGGLGLQDIIYQQLLDKYGAQFGIKPATPKPQGPLPLNESANFHPRFLPGENKMSTRFDREPAAEARPLALQAPWAGKLLGAQEINPNEYVVNLGHDNGLRSQFVFRGNLTNPNLDSRVEAGQQIGLLSPDAQSFFWNLQRAE